MTDWSEEWEIPDTPADPAVLKLMSTCHEQAHDAPHDIEDGVLVSLTQREVWLTVMAYLLLSQSAECLADLCADTTERLIELLDVQKPHWRMSETDR